MLRYKLSKWQKAEIALLVIGVIQIILRWMGVNYPYQMEAIFTPLSIVTYGYLFSAFGSVFFLWKLSKGLILVSFIFYIYAHMVSSALLLRYMNWPNSDEMAVYSYIFISIGFIIAFVYYLIKGRKKPDLFKRIVAPLVIRSLILYVVITVYLLFFHEAIRLLG